MAGPAAFRLALVLVGLACVLAAVAGLLPGHLRRVSWARGLAGLAPVPARQGVALPGRRVA
jgi:hypothetical protein